MTTPDSAQTQTQTPIRQAGREAGRPWWKEPWPWLLMSGPLVAMAGCAVTIWLALTHPDPPLAEGVAHHGLVVEKVEPGLHVHASPAPSSASAR